MNPKASSCLKALSISDYQQHSGYRPGSQRSPAIQKTFFVLKNSINY